MHCYKIIIIKKIKLQKLKFVIYLIFFFFFLANLCFFKNKWHYRVLLIQLLRVLCPPQRIRKKEKEKVKSHSLRSKLSTIKNHTM